MIPRDRAALGLRVVWLFVLFSHVGLAAVAFRLLPQGFPVLQRRFVLSTLAPVCIGAGSLALAVAVLIAPRTGTRFLALIPSFWAAGAFGLWLVFPETGAAAARPMALVALQLAVLAGFTCRALPVREWLPAAVLGAASGFGVACAERPALPATQPSHLEPPRRTGEPGGIVAPELELARDLVVDSSSLAVTWSGPEATLSIAPTLDFDRTPPDGFWSIFTDTIGTAPHIAATERAAADSLALWASDGTERLFVQDKTSSVEIEAWTRLARPIYSHLNSFTTVSVSGHRRLALRFSPCPEALIAVTHADYPAGAPARFAYVDAGRHFHVVQATDAEKGPFTSLAEGRLAVGAPLAIDLVELSEGERTLARLEFLDFAAQLSTGLSPTAGHGVSENAIEFGLAATDPSSRAQILLTLAASGIGRGWDSVGHRAGVYRNRIVLRPFERSQPTVPKIQSTTRSAGPAARSPATAQP